MNEHPRTPTSEITRALNKGSVLSVGRSGPRACIRVSSEPFNSGKGLGKIGRCGMSVSGPDRFDSILGRPSYQGDLLLGDSLYPSLGSSLHIFVPSLCVGTPPSDGGERGDFQLLVNIVQSIDQYSELLDTLKALTTVRAIHYLHYSFGAGDEEIEVNGMASSPFKLLKNLPALETLPADTLAPISFWGGPPSKTTWYEGSLLTLLIDRILRAYYLGDQSILSRFLTIKKYV